ncbi:putative thioester reductase domain-containing protein [Rosellinia necatrix]|uniref:Putative thioester reductase domain-containing protein n=1 Tax=Rosellinia necatrix TaxID=77044 RepID=A0A1S7UI89_ROSNE|nr:putative thioester reductase domain-containing protein [Rosellinia necatrix]
MLPEVGPPLPCLVDDIAQSDPGRIVYSVAKTKDPADGFDDIRAVDFARAVNRCAWFIDQTLGPGKDFPTLVYMGPQDLNYPIFVLASIKAGYKLFVTSPRNTLQAHLSLLETLECNVFLTPPPLNFPLPIINQILAERPMRRVEVADFRYWLSGDDGDGDASVKPYPYAKTISEARAEPFVVLHTSGTTGLPKPIVTTHGTAAALSLWGNCSHQNTPIPALFKGDRVYITFPLFHIAGLYSTMASCLYAGFTTVLAAFPPSPDIVNGVHVHGNVQHTLLAPAVLEGLTRVPEYLESLSRLTHAVYGGGPLPREVGDLALTKTRILNGFGSTECGILPCQVTDDPRDWQYLRLHPDLGYEYRPVSDGLYEQVMVRDEARLLGQGVFATFPDITEWPMKDIYSKHPDPAKGDLWLYKGRTDDIIVFSTGEKLNPSDMEDIINGNPTINAALVSGHGRFQSSLLIEAVNAPANAEDEQRLLDAIWPSVQAANKECPSHGRIHRNMITFTSAAEPMLRAGKGTVQRRQTLDLYASQLNSLYESSNQINGEKHSEYNSVEAAIKAIVSSNTEIDAQSISLEIDLFELGLDSLQVNIIAKTLNEYLASHGKPQSIAPRTVYSNPTLAALIDAVSVIMSGSTASSGNDEEKLEELYQFCTENLPISGRDPSPRSSDSSVVLMTGSTGSMGSYIVDSLQRDDRVSRIYCLCRGPESVRRQETLQASKGLAPLSDKVQCLDADLFKSHFGLAADKYRELLGGVTHVIHNAWQVDFNLTIHSFARHVGFVRRLVDFASHSRLGAELFFISSISAVGGLAGDVAEDVYAGWATPVASGYGQSKFLSERLLDAAARHAGVPATVCRVGQVAGPTTAAGEWPRKEWLPSLVASSRYLGKLPDSIGARLGAVDWVPVDKLGQSVAELALHPRSRDPDAGAGATVYHAINPHSTTWAALLPGVARYLGQGRAVEVVSLEAWVAALRDSAARTEDIAANPAIKLLDFFESLAYASGASLSTERTLPASPTLSTIGPVHDAWMENWMRQWGF